MRSPKTREDTPFPHGIFVGTMCLPDESPVGSPPIVVGTTSPFAPSDAPPVSVRLPSFTKTKTVETSSVAAVSEDIMAVDAAAAGPSTTSAPAAAVPTADPATPEPTVESGGPSDITADTNVTTAGMHVDDEYLPDELLDYTEDL